MKESYCIKDKRRTPSIEPSGYQEDKYGRTIFFCKCGDCRTIKKKYVKTPIIVPSEYEQNTIDKYKLLSRL